MVARIFEALLIGFGLINLPIAVVELSEEEEWAEYHAEALAEYADEFTRLFDAMEYKRSKNGRSMIRRPGDTTYRFVKGAK